jgi:flavin prenyltransferase
MRVFLGVTGASGALYGGHALRALTGAGCDVGLCVSDAGAHVISHEILEAGPRPHDERGATAASFF